MSNVNFTTNTIVYLVDSLCTVIRVYSMYFVQIYIELCMSVSKLETHRARPILTLGYNLYNFKKTIQLMFYTKYKSSRIILIGVF